jgi:flagellar assembly protein FliH
MNSPAATPRKFVFETVFEPDGRVTAPVRPQRQFSAEEVEAIRAMSFAEGQRSTLAKAQDAQTEALRQVADAAQAALATLAAVAHDHRVGAAKLALAAAGKIADAALKDFPQAPIAAAIEALAREVDAVPRLVARVAPDRVEAVQAALSVTAAACGYPGQIVARADARMNAAAFVLDWGDGSAAFDPAQAAARVAQALDTALAAEGLHAEPLLPITPTPNARPDHG